MLDWIRQHHQAVNTLANLGMLTVWVAYLQLFLWNYRRERRTQILINSGAGRNLDARCLISNMSAEAVYVEAIIVTLRTEDRELSCSVTEVEDLAGDETRADPKEATRQGPLQSGGFMQIGSFRELLARVARENQLGSSDLVPSAETAIFEVQVVASYAAENLLAAARKQFAICEGSDGTSVQSLSLTTEQIRGRGERSRLEGMLRTVTHGRSQ